MPDASTLEGLALRVEQSAGADREELLRKLRKYSRSALLTSDLRGTLLDAFIALGGSDGDT